MRDALLSASGKLDDRTVGGQSVDLWARPYPTRRSLYGFIDRQNLPGVFRTFDLATPDTTSPKRFVTTVPQQALFFLNSPFVAEQARALVARPGFRALNDTQRVRALYRRLYGRDPSVSETALGLDYVHAPLPAEARPDAPLWQYGFGRYDEAAKRTTGFTPFPKFDGGIWHGAGGLPDPIIHYCSLNAIGGHPGGDAAHAAVRRWTAPRIWDHPNCGYTETSRRAWRRRPRPHRIQPRRPAGRMDGPSQRNGDYRGIASVVGAERATRWISSLTAATNDGYDSFAWSPTLSLLNGGNRPGAHKASSAARRGLSTR